MRYQVTTYSKRTATIIGITRSPLSLSTAQRLATRNDASMVEIIELHPVSWPR